MSWRMPLVLPWVLVVFSAAWAGDILHVVRPGDTPAALAKAYRVPLAAILERNKGLDPCAIKVGEMIIVPVAPKTPVALPDEEEPGRRYVVAPGDAPAAIAARFGVSLDALSRANPGLAPKTLAVGRVLTIPVAACPAPVPVSRPGQAAVPMVTEFQ